MTDISSAMQRSQGQLVRRLLNAKGDVNYWLDSHRCYSNPECHLRLWRKKFNAKKDILICRNIYCRRHDQPQGYADRKEKS